MKKPLFPEMESGIENNNSIGPSDTQEKIGRILDSNSLWHPKYLERKLLNENVNFILNVIKKNPEFKEWTEYLNICPEGFWVGLKSQNMDLNELMSVAKQKNESEKVEFFTRLFKDLLPPGKNPIMRLFLDNQWDQINTLATIDGFEEVGEDLQLNPWRFSESLERFFSIGVDLECMIEDEMDKKNKPE